VPGGHRDHRFDGEAAPAELGGDGIRLGGRLLADRGAAADLLVGRARQRAAPLGDGARQQRLQETEPAEAGSGSVNCIPNSGIIGKGFARRLASGFFLRALGSLLFFHVHGWLFLGFLLGFHFLAHKHNS
jgi:hypothetical protein